jgi:nucleoside phosphorylase
MSDTISVESLKGKVDFAVITIRPDEYNAVLARLGKKMIVVGGKSRCEFATIHNAYGEPVNILVGRTSGQGQGAAQRLAKNMVVEFSPRWLVLVGIAGAFPNDDFSLGDVAIATKIIDLAVSAINYNSEIEYTTGGGQLHPDVQNLVSLLPGRASALGSWNERECINQDKPSIKVPRSPSNKALIGDDSEHKQRVIRSLSKHFSKSRPPLFHPACLATSNTLVKNPSAVTAFKKVARDIEHVEMEAGGVYQVSMEGTPLLSVRGISDIVGFKREDVWTIFACNTAAAFFISLITNFQRSVFGDAFVTQYNLPHDDSSIAIHKIHKLVDLRREMQRVSDWLLQYKLDESRRIDFAIENDLVELNANQSVSLLLGPPGSGKTCLLARIGNRFATSGTAVLAIKADLFPHYMKTMAEWASAELTIGVNFFELVQTISARESVVVLVDQLDALASTVDLTSSRLNEIVSFIRKCAELPNVYVICSCRSFDYSYDSRFRRLSTKTYQLSLPTWEQASEKLKAAGVIPEQIPPKLQQLLRTPQHLAIFTRLKSRVTANTFETYSEMLGEFWNASIRSAEEIDFVFELTAKLVETESIWTPLAAITFDEKVVSKLCSDGLLERKHNQLRFSHQTIQEYAVARLFAESEASLTSFVAAHQDTIFNRPTIWAVLSYLRDNAEKKYYLELDSILKSGPRAHVKFLIIDFICRQSYPSEYEVEIIGRWLVEEHLRPRILSGIVDKPAWFEALKHSHIPSIMSGSVEEQWPLLFVLISAWRFDWDGVLLLVREHWLKHSEFDLMTLRVLENSANWTRDVLSLIEQAAIRSKGNYGHSFQIESVVAAMSKKAPEDAARLAARVISTRTNLKLESTSISDNPLEARDGWYGLEEVAKAAPSAFLNEITPWLVATADEHCIDYHGSVLAHYPGSCWLLDKHNHYRESSLLTSIQTCVDLMSRLNPEAFASLFRRYWQSENAVVHRIFIEGLLNIVGRCPEDVFEYIISDDRRFTVGQSRDTQGSRSVELINQLFPHLSDPQRTHLIEKIHRWSKYKSEVVPCESQLQWDRESRLHLLCAIPVEFRTRSLSEFIELEKTELPNWDQELIFSHHGSVRTIPPMDQVEMETASDELLIDAFRTIKQDRNEMKRIEGGFEVYGGCEAAADELSKLAECNPSRAAYIIRLLVLKGLTTHIHRSLRGFSKGRDRELVLNMILEISSVCGDSEEFRASASDLLRSLCDDYGLPDEVNLLLESWLAKPWRTTNTSHLDGNKREWKPEISFLWTNGGSVLLDTDNSYFTLVAITESLLNKKAPQADRWVTLLSSQLDGDISYNTWVMLSRRLVYVRATYCSPELGKKLISKLFAKFPSLASETFGCGLLAMLAKFLDPDFLKGILDRLAESSDEFDQQAAGELITLCSLLDATAEWGAPLLQNHLFDGEVPAPAFLVGTAHAAVNLWIDLNKPKECSRIVAKVIGFGNSDATNTLRRLFRNDVWLPADEQASVIVRELTKRIESISEGLAEDVLAHLTRILPHLRLEILAFSKHLVETRFNELRRREFNAYEVGQHLVEIAMTLQRFDDTRSAGLDLFEALLSAGLNEANQALKDVDAVDDVLQESLRSPTKRRGSR